MSRKPKNFHEWRSLLHETWKQLGQYVTMTTHMKEMRLDAIRCGCDLPVARSYGMDRHVWKISHRAYRIQLHCQAELRAGTNDAMRAVMEMLEAEGDSPDE